MDTYRCSASCRGSIVDVKLTSHNGRQNGGDEKEQYEDTVHGQLLYQQLCLSNIGIDNHLVLVDI